MKKKHQNYIFSEFESMAINHVVLKKSRNGMVGFFIICFDFWHEDTMYTDPILVHEIRKRTDP